MREKIKNLFGFVGRAWSGGIRGKVGILFAIFAGFMFIRIFWGARTTGARAEKAGLAGPSYHPNSGLQPRLRSGTGAEVSKCWRPQF